MPEIVAAPVYMLERSALPEYAGHLAALAEAPEVAGLLDERAQSEMVARLLDPDAVQSWLVTAQENGNYGDHNVALLLDRRTDQAVGYGIRDPRRTMRDLGGRIPALEPLARRAGTPARVVSPGGAYVFAWLDNRRGDWLDELTDAYGTLAMTAEPHPEAVPSWTIEPERSATRGISGAILGAGFQYVATGRYDLGGRAVGRGRQPKSELYMTDPQ